MFQQFMQPQRNTLSKAINEDRNQNKEIEHTLSLRLVARVTTISESQGLHRKGKTEVLI